MLKYSVSGAADGAAKRKLAK